MDELDDVSDILEDGVMIGIGNGYFIRLTDTRRIKEGLSFYSATVFRSRAKLAEAVNAIKRRKKKYVLYNYCDHLASFYVAKLSRCQNESRRKELEDNFLMTVRAFCPRANIDSVRRFLSLEDQMRTDQYSSALAALLRGETSEALPELPDLSM